MENLFCSRERWTLRRSTEACNYCPPRRREQQHLCVNERALCERAPASVEKRDPRRSEMSVSCSSTQDSRDSPSLSPPFRALLHSQKLFFATSVAPSELRTGPASRRLTRFW